MRKNRKELDTHGCLALVEAMVKAASDDFLKSPADSEVSEDAAKFFRSKYFTTLTGVDGKIVLKQLEKQRDDAKKRKEGE